MDFKANIIKEENLKEEPSCSFSQNSSDVKTCSLLPIVKSEDESKDKSDKEGQPTDVPKTKSSEITNNNSFSVSENIMEENLKEEPSCSFSQNSSDVKTICSLLPIVKSEDESKNKSDKEGQPTDVPKTKSSEVTNNNSFSVSDMTEDYKETYEAYISEVTAIASIPILDSVTAEHIKNFKTFNLRYYEDKYCINFIDSETGYNDILIRIHTNKIFLIALASGNDIIRQGKQITGINFMVNNNDRSKVKLRGKHKRGAKVIEPHTILCQVKCEGIAKMFNIRAGVPGKVFEINELVKNNPNLLRTDPKGCGFLAVVAPIGHPSNYEQEMSKLKLLSEEEYIKYLFGRPPKFSDISESLLKEK